VLRCGHCRRAGDCRAVAAGMATALFLRTRAALTVSHPHYLSYKRRHYVCAHPYNHGVACRQAGEGGALCCEQHAVCRCGLCYRASRIGPVGVLHLGILWAAPCLADPAVFSPRLPAWPSFAAKPLRACRCRLDVPNSHASIIFKHLRGTAALSFWEEWREEATHKLRVAARQWKNRSRDGFFSPAKDSKRRGCCADYKGITHLRWREGQPNTLPSW